MIRMAQINTKHKTTMNTLFDRLERHFPFIGERAVEIDDLFELCTGRGVAVVFAPEISRGVYVRDSTGGEHIFLNSMLHGVSLMYVFAHEVAHMLLHVPQKSSRQSVVSSQHAEFGFDGKRCSRVNHDEAETAAALLMIPKVDPLDPILIEHADPRFAQLIAYRLHYLTTYGK